VRVFLYDAFTERPFGGNPTAVFLDAHHLDAREMQQIATELQAPNTAFAVRTEAADPPRFHVRYFTPQREIDLCGAADVAIFTALVDEGRVRPHAAGATAGHLTAAGELPVKLYTAPAGVTVEMAQRRPCFFNGAPATAQIEEILGGLPSSLSLPVEIVSTGLRHLIVPFASVADLGRVKPDFPALAEFASSLDVHTVCVFALSRRMPACVRVRDFCPAIGADEEPASGTTAGALACYLAKYSRISPDHNGNIHVAVEQGVEIDRPSAIQVRLHLCGNTIERVTVRGRAVRTLQGEIEIAD